MITDPSELYAQRLHRYVTAMRNGKPDRVPLRPFAAEFTATYAGFTAQQVTHDYNQAFEAVIRTCAGFDWDAAVPNMVYVWTGLTQAANLRYYATPGIDVGPDIGFQYREPEQDNAWMRREEYDELIDDPVGFLYRTWLPRVSADFALGPYRQSLALVKSTWAMANYFNAFGPQVERMRRETGTVSAICGMLKAPLDVLADKFRGYLGLAFDLMEIPEKVEAACRALMPHLAQIAIGSLDPTRMTPIPIWMHRGCVPFISREHFNSIYWPTLKPIVEAIWARGNQTLFYAEGKWDAHLDAFAELPAGSIIFHLDRSDFRLAHEKLGSRFCLSGGVPNSLLAFGTPQQVKDHCRLLIDTCAGNGGFIMDASAIMQNDATVENVRAMTDCTRDYGQYSRFACSDAPPEPTAVRPPAPAWAIGRIPPGACLPWVEKTKELPVISGDPDLCRKVWEDVDSLAYLYIWHLVLSF
ncbi:uroporphyrinogen decarboxylase family protein [uncultured Paludibaculum sp.]|uniref:uroporphyrinogen decarboxylase family protein n=1 Tax=uncultured Paludibaculum sp. TaxID=1765020 RepID=UPI002AAC3DF7|nr:uroporphyrinogen decarboxylase family protein [uncultured Paludibaculum sp.]